MAKVTKSRIFGALIALPPAALAAHFIDSDFGSFGFGVILIFALYATSPFANPAAYTLTADTSKNLEISAKIRAALITALGLLYFYINPNNMNFLLFSLISVICILCYNGRLGPKHPAIKYSFYAFYPAHLIFLALISPLLSHY
jgi:hypothetical protein